MVYFFTRTYIVWLVLAALAAASLSATNDKQRTVEVSSSRAEYSSDGKSTTFSGNVTLSASGLTINADRLSVHTSTDGYDYVADGAPLSLFCDDCGEHIVYGKIGKHLNYNDATGIAKLTGGLHLCLGDNCARGELEADSAVWRRNDDIIIAQGAPVVILRWQGDNDTNPVILTAENTEYRLSNGDLKLTGNANIHRGSDKITGKIIRFNIHTGALAAEGSSEQRVKATFEKHE